MGQHYQHVDYINKIHHGLEDFFYKTASDAMRFLFMVNAGGSVAVLSFMGSSEKIRLMILPRLSLVSFGIGLILTGLLYAFRFLYASRIMRQWNVDLRKYGSEGHTLEEIVEKLNANMSKDTHLIILGWLSFIAFVGGVILGGIALFS